MEIVPELAMATVQASEMETARGLVTAIGPIALATVTGIGPTGPAMATVIVPIGIGAMIFRLVTIIR